MRQRIPRGFTLVELVVTILLVAILAATVAPRFFGSSAFDAQLVRDSLIAKLRAQQQALLVGQTDCKTVVTNNSIGLSGQCRDADSVCDSSSGDFAPSQCPTITMLDADISIELTDLNKSQFELEFNNDGVPINDCSGGCTIEISADDVTQVCIGSQGFVDGC